MDADAVRHQLRLVAHDMRSMLGPIMGFAELITAADDVEQCQSHAARITLAAARLESLADDLIGRVFEGEGPGQAPRSI